MPEPFKNVLVYNSIVKLNHKNLLWSVVFFTTKRRGERPHVR